MLYFISFCCETLVRYLEKEKTYSKYPTPACTVKIHALGKSVLNLQGVICKPACVGVLMTLTLSSIPLTVNVASSLFSIAGNPCLSPWVVSSATWM